MAGTAVHVRVAGVAHDVIGCLLLGAPAEEEPIAAVQKLNPVVCGG
jgi:hypothetical protein